MPKKRATNVNVGIDVGKHQLDVFIHERAIHFTVTNDPQDIRELLGRLARCNLSRVVVICSLGVRKIRRSSSHNEASVFRN